MNKEAEINIQQFINAQRLSAFQIGVLVLCFAVMALDGFDIVAIGFIAPALRASWHLTATELAPMLGASLFGLMIGSFVFGPLADKVGRKKLLLITTMFFGLASLASAQSSSVIELSILRFLTGMGLGGAIPSAVALTSEFCPDRRRSFLTTVMYCGFFVGSTLGGLAAAHLVADFGWTSILLTGGVLPLALAPVLAWALPESAHFLVLKRAQAERIAEVLNRIAPTADLAGARFTSTTRPANPIGQLFKPGLATGTLLLWLSYFTSLMVYYLLSNWLPTIISSAGMSLKDASLLTLLLPLGSTVGALLLGVLMDRMNPHFVLGISFAASALFVALIGSVISSPALLATAIFCVGFSLGGGCIGNNVLAAGFYPTANRTTGVAWANAVGRGGSVVGSMTGGILASGLGLPTACAIVAIPTVIAGVSYFAKARLAPQPSHDRHAGSAESSTLTETAAQI